MYGSMLSKALVLLPKEGDEVEIIIVWMRVWASWVMSGRNVKHHGWQMVVFWMRLFFFFCEWSCQTVDGCAPLQLPPFNPSFGLCLHQSMLSNSGMPLSQITLSSLTRFLVFFFCFKILNSNVNFVVFKLMILIRLIIYVKYYFFGKINLSDKTNIYIYLFIFKY